MDNLIKDLKSSETSVVYATLEALEVADPTLLKANIVPLLLHSDVGLRSRAARAMYRWDSNEAVRYFGAMLFSQRVNEREAALVNSFFFPFKQIEALLLKFLTIENEAYLIQKAGLLFMANPDKAIASKLFEAKEATKGLRSDLINSIMMGVLNSLYQAKLETEAPLSLVKIIKKEYREKRIKLYVNHFSALLGSEESETRLNAAVKLCDLVRQNLADVKELINAYLITERDESIVNKVKLYLESGSTKVDISQISHGKDSEGRKKIYASINEETYPKLIKFLLPELNKIEKSEQIIVLTFIEKYGNESETDYVLQLLGNQDSFVQQAAIECLSKINLTALKPKLQSLMKSQSDEVRLSAVNVYALFNKGQVLIELSQMMNSVRASQRRSALFCLGNMDFASVSDILIKSLSHETDKKLKEDIFSILLENADDEIFCKLYLESKSIKAEYKSEFNNFLTKLSQKLRQDTDERKKLYAEAENRWNEEEAARAQREEYRLEKIQKLRKKVDGDWQEKVELIKFTFICHSIGFILTLVIWFAFISPNALLMKKEGVSPNFPQKQSSNSFKEDNKVILPKEAINVKGSIVEFNVKHRQAMFKESSGKVYLLNFPEDSPVYESGKDFAGQIFVEDYNDGVYIAEVIIIF